MPKILKNISRNKWHVVLYLSAAVLLISVFTTLAQPPTWWQAKGAIDPNAAENNQALANIGQAKHMATQAETALSEILTNGSGIDLSTRIPAKPANPDPAWFEDQKKLLNLGQLKHLSQPFYVRLNQISPAWVESQLQQNGLTTLGTNYHQDTHTGYFYPWNPATPVSENLKPANIGQLKLIFSLRFNQDTDNNGQPDGLPDLWEYQIINASDTDAITTLEQVTPQGDFDGDGVDNLTEY